MDAADSQRLARRRAFRIRVVAMIAASYAMDTAFLAAFSVAGTVAYGVAVAYALAGGLLSTAQFAAYRTGWSERFTDSYLTLPIVMASALLQIAFLVWAPEAGLVFLFVLLIICSFGALRLTVAHFAVAWMTIVLGTGAVLLAVGERVTFPGATLLERAFAWLLFAVTLGRCVVVWLYGSAIRASLHERNLRLSVAEKAVREQAAALESTVEERTAALRAALAEIEEFSYSMSHNLRAPVRAVIANARLLEEDFDDQLPQGARRLVARLAETGAQMGAMVDGLIELLGIVRAKPVCGPLDLSRIAREVWSGVERAEPAATTALEVADGLAAFGDETLVRELLRRLLDNARKFSRGSAAPRVVLGAELRGAERVFFVKDNGAGFDPAYSQKLFRPFEHLHGVGEFEGQGLGLAIARRIVERHAGRMWAESAPGEGATFYFTLPEPAEA